MPDLVFASRGAAEVIRQQTLINERAQEMSQIYRDDARAARELEAAVMRVFKNTANPAKQFNEEMGRMLGNYKQGKLNAEQYEKAVSRLEQTYRDTQTTSGKLTAVVAKAFSGDMLKSLLAYGAGLASVSGAINLMRSEYESLVALIDKQADTQMDVSTARNVVIRNMLGESPEAIRQTLAELQKLSTELRVPEQVLAPAFAEALSASGGRTADALNALRLSAQFLGDQPQEIGLYSGSLIDLQKATGVSDQRVNFGLLAKIGQLSRVATPQNIAANAPKALLGATGFGATPQEAAALYSTLTQLYDPEGRAAATAQGQLAKQLFFFGEQLRGTPLDAAGGELAGMTMGQRIGLLQRTPELARIFLEGDKSLKISPATFETQFTAPIRQLLLNPQGESGRTLRAFQADIPDFEGLAALSQQAMDNFQLNEFEPMAQRQRSLMVLRDRLRLRGGQLLGASEREILQESLQRLGGANVSSRLRMFVGQLADGSVGISPQDALAMVEGEQQWLTTPRKKIRMSGGSFGPTTYDMVAPTAQDQENARLLQDVIDVLRAQLDAQRETNRKLEGGGLVGGDL